MSKINSMQNYLSVAERKLVQYQIGVIKIHQVHIDELQSAI